MICVVTMAQEATSRRSLALFLGRMPSPDYSFNGAQDSSIVRILAFEDPHQSCERSRTGQHFYFVVLNGGSGECISMGSLDTRIHHNTSLGLVVRQISRLIGWPVEYFSLVIGTTHFRCTFRDSFRYPNLLQELRKEVVRQGLIPEEGVLPITVVKRSPPGNFIPPADGRCICDFRGCGCCKTGRTDAFRENCLLSRHCFRDNCDSCGHCDLCRRGECGHSCCEDQRTDESDDWPGRLMW